MVSTSVCSNFLWGIYCIWYIYILYIYIYYIFYIIYLYIVFATNRISVIVLPAECSGLPTEMG